MFIDEAVIAGVLVVGLTLAFLGGVALFIWRDSQKASKGDNRP